MARSDSEGVPPAQYLGADFVIEEMGEQGARRVTGLSTPQILLLAIMGGGLITMGAIFSLLLGASVGSSGPQRLLEGLGFSTGFFFVILVSAILFYRGERDHALGHARLRVAGARPRPVLGTRLARQPDRRDRDRRILVVIPAAVIASAVLSLVRG